MSELQKLKERAFADVQVKREYDALEETAHILGPVANRARIMESMRQIEAGEAKERELKE